MAKKFDFDDELASILIDVFLAGKKAASEKTAIDPVVAEASRHIKALIDRRELVRIQQVAHTPPR